MGCPCEASNVDVRKTTTKEEIMNRFEELVAGVVAKIEDLRKEQRVVRITRKPHFGRGVRALSMMIKHERERLIGLLEYYQFYEEKLINHPEEMTDLEIDSLQTYQILLGDIYFSRKQVEHYQALKAEEKNVEMQGVIDYYIEEYQEQLDHELEILTALPEAADLVRRNYLMK